jgi:DNA-binding winged helix-turn-helix (wHTH) protein
LVLFDDKLPGMQSMINTTEFCSAGLLINPESRQVHASVGQGFDESTGSLPTPVRLGPVNMSVLLVLINSHGNVVTRTELFDQVWKNQVVSDDTLTRCISDLRSQLGKLSVYPKLIETIPKQGYRWIAPIDDKTTSGPRHSSELQRPLGRNGPNDSSSARNTFDRTLAEASKVERAQTTKRWIIWAGLTLLGLVLFLSVFLLGINQLVQSKIMAVALIPAKLENVTDKQRVLDFEDELRAKLLETENIRFLSSRMFAAKEKALYPYLSREFSVRWIIEADIRTSAEQSRVVVNIVDARTAIVFDSLSLDISNPEVGIKIASDKVVQLLQNNVD